MGQIIYLGVFPLALIFFNFDKRNKHKYSKFFSAYLFLYVLLLCAGSLSNNDTLIYYNFYVQSATTFQSKDVGYGVLLWLSHQLKWSYLGLRLFEYACGFVCLHFVVKRLCPLYEPFFWLLYIVYPMIYDNIEVRNYIATMLLFVAIYFIAKGKKQIGFSIFILACLLHKITFIYSPIIVFTLFSRKCKVQKINLTIIGILFFFLLLLGANKNILAGLLNKMPEAIKSIPGIGRNLQSTNNRGWIVDYAQLILLFFVLSLNVYLLRTALKRKTISKTQLVFCNIAIILGLYSLLFAPFYAFSGDFLRVVRNITPLNYCCGLVLLQNIKRCSKFRLLPLYLALCICMGFIPMLSIFYSQLQGILIYDTFINNWIWNLGSKEVFFVGQDNGIFNIFKERDSFLNI